MRRDEPDYAMPSSFDTPLRKSYELYVVIVYPLRIAFAQWLPVNLKVVGGFPSLASIKRLFALIASQVLSMQQRLNPDAIVCRFPSVRRVTYNYHHWRIALDARGGIGLVCDELATEQMLALLDSLLERVGEVDAEAILIACLEGPARPLALWQVQPGELHAQPQMRHRIRRHQQLEAKQARQQALAHVGRPRPGVVGCAEPLAYQIDHAGEEGARASRWIQQHDRMPVGARAAGQPLRQPEIAPQQRIHRARDVRDDRLRRVIDAAQVAQLRVVGLQERLVEVDDGVFGLRALAEVAQHGGHIGIG